VAQVVDAGLASVAGLVRDVAVRAEGAANEDRQSFSVSRGAHRRGSQHARIFNAHLDVVVPPLTNFAQQLEVFVGEG
jgi:hypothetical protein